MSDHESEGPDPFDFGADPDSDSDESFEMLQRDDAGRDEQLQNDDTSGSVDEHEQNAAQARRELARLDRKIQRRHERERPEREAAEAILVRIDQDGRPHRYIEGRESSAERSDDRRVAVAREEHLAEDVERRDRSSNRDDERRVERGGHPQRFDERRDRSADRDVQRRFDREGNLQRYDERRDRSSDRDDERRVERVRPARELGEAHSRRDRSTDGDDERRVERGRLERDDERVERSADPVRGPPVADGEAERPFAYLRGDSDDGYHADGDHSPPPTRHNFNANAAVFVPAAIKTCPQISRFFLFDTDDERKRGMLAGLFAPIEAWRSAIRNYELLADVERVYPTLLPLQKKAIPLIITTLDVDVILQVPPGQGSTTCWMLPVIDRCLGHRSRPCNISYLIFTSGRTAAERLRDQIKEFMPQIEGPPPFYVDILCADPTNESRNNSVDMQRKLERFGMHVLITTPEEYANSFGRIRNKLVVRSIIIEKYNEMFMDDREYFKEIYEEMNERDRIKTTLIARYPQADITDHLRRDAIRVQMDHQQVERPQLDFAYVPKYSEAYDKLRELLKKFRHGTTIVFVRSYDKVLYEVIPAELPNLVFGLLHRDTHSAERRDTLLTYRTGRYDVLIAPHTEEPNLESRFRCLDINFDVPMPRTELAQRLAKKDRIYHGHAYWFLDNSNEGDMHEFYLHCNMMTDVLENYEARMKARNEEKKAEREAEERRLEKEREEDRLNREWDQRVNGRRYYRNYNNYGGQHYERGYNNNSNNWNY